MGLRSTSILLVFALLLASFNKVIHFAGYSLNKEYIANVLCENKAKPKSQCLGKCYLNKKLKQAEKQEKKQGVNSMKNLMDAVLGSQCAFVFFKFPFAKHHVKGPSVLLDFPVKKVFQPPQHSQT